MAGRKKISKMIHRKIRRTSQKQKVRAERTKAISLVKGWPVSKKVYAKGALAVSTAKAGVARLSQKTIIIGLGIVGFIVYKLGWLKSKRG